MIGAPLLVVGVLLTLSALLGARVAELERTRGIVVGTLLAPVHPATWAAVAAIVVGFFVGIVAFSVVVGLFSVGASLLVVGIGVVLIGVGIELARIVARGERARARWADPRPLYAHPYRPFRPGLIELIPTVFLDLSRWRDVLYVLIAFPLVILEFVVAVVLWSTAVALLSVPVWALIGEPVALPSSVTVAPGAVALVAGLSGVALLVIAAAATRGLMALHRAVVSGLLCQSERRALEQRVASLEVSRRTVLDAEASELRRIERDLHDGAQQRLVALSMQLGLAAERIDEDPAAARELVEDARDQARQALAEIRDLVRGIAPAILLDRGLVPALSALAGRAAVATVVTSAISDGLRLSDAVERGAYFVVAESLTNVGKHAGATHAEVRCRIDAGQLVIEVEDDGRGGATLTPGGGLAGLAGRVDALDGRLTVSSPVGGPTVVRAAIPVGVSATASPGAIPGWPVSPPPQEPR